MRPRNGKNSNRYRTKQQSCPQYFRPTWHTIPPPPDNNDGTMASFLVTLKTNGILPSSYSTENIRSFDNKHFHNLRKSSARTSSTPILRNLGDTDDTEDEGFSHYRGRLTSVSSQESWEILRRQATSMGSLTSSYSSLGERSASTLSPLDDQGSKHLSTSLRAILDPDFSGDFDYDHDPKMRETIEDIVSPKPIKTTSQSQFNPTSSKVVSATGLAPSILEALPGRDSNSPKVAPTKYWPTALCDLRCILNNPAPATEVTESRTDLALLRVGTQPVNDTNADDALTRRGWNIPTEEVEEEALVPHTTNIPYRKLSEPSESEEDFCLLSSHDLSRLSHNESSSLCNTSRSASVSSAGDSSDYLADISGEETTSRHVTMWPPCKKLKLDLEDKCAPFVLFPRIPGVDYYGVPTSILVTSSERVSRGLDAFFNSRSIVHRLGPHGVERVYDMEQCPERCGFAYPVPSQDVLS